MSASFWATAISARTSLVIGRGRAGSSVARNRAVSIQSERVGAKTCGGLSLSSRAISASASVVRAARRSSESTTEDMARWLKRWLRRVRYSSSRKP